jgi:hypothetical protein
VGLQKLVLVLVFVALLAGSFVAGQFFLPTGPEAASERMTPRAASTEKVVPETTTKDDTASAPVAAEQTPSSESTSREPLTCAEASRIGDRCIGERVTWVGKWIHSQSARVGHEKGSQHIFNTQGPQGDYSFDCPFIAEDPNPLERAAKGQNVKERHDKRWGSTRIVTVTGTIARLETLVFIGKGTRHDVPVLSNITITISP